MAAGEEPSSRPTSHWQQHAVEVLSEAAPPSPAQRIKAQRQTRDQAPNREARHDDKENLHQGRPRAKRDTRSRTALAALN